MSAASSAITKYFSLLALLVVVGWFFWNPDGWEPQWRPLVAFVAALSAFIAAEWKHRHAVLASRPILHTADSKLFSQILNLLPSNGAIRFLREWDFLGAFDLKEVRPIFAFYEEWNAAEHEFIDQELEGVRRDLHKATARFSHAVAKYTSPSSSGLQSVRHDFGDYDERTQARYRREAKEINDAADIVVEKHQSLVKLARRKFRSVGDAE